LAEHAPFPRPKVTIADIARESELSSATVSLALRSKGGIRAETRQRVLEIAQRLGYQLQPSNRSETQQAINSVGVLVKGRPDDLGTTHRFYGPVVAGIEEVCRRRQIHLVYANLLVDDENRPIAPPRLLSDQQTDGLLLIGMHLDQQHLARFQGLDSPIVLVDAYADGDPYDAVVTDNFAGAYQATRHLIEQGHRHIAILGSLPHAFPSVAERRAGYCQALRDHQLSPYFWDCPLWPKAAHDAARTYLAQTTQVTAVFGCNDAVTIALLQVAQANGYQIPHDLSLVGFDNIDLAQLTAPPLTSVWVDQIGMGRQAAQLLINRIEYPAAAIVRTLIRPQLIQRQSVIKRET